jgi:cobalt-zinc-cadmium efflux system membrane fusion protein
MATPPAANTPPSLEGRAWAKARQQRLLALLAAVALVIGLGLWLAQRFRHGPPAEPPPPPGTFRPTPAQLKSLTVATVANHSFATAAVTEGKIAVNADRTTPVFSPYSGRIVRVLAGIGDRVAPGAALATVEASEFTQAQSDLATARAQVALARITLARKKALYEAEGASLADVQQAEADTATAEGLYQAVRGRLAILGQSGAQIDALEKSGRVAPLASIVAPIGGVVIDRALGPGQFVAAGAASPVFTVADLSSVWLLAQVPEAESVAVQRGQPLEVRVLAFPGRKFSARVAAVAGTVDPATHRVAVRAEIDNRELLLKPEMFASFRIVTSDADEAPAVPESAVVYEGEAAHVWVVAPGDVLMLRAVRTGRTEDGLVELREGLKAGERVVTRGSLFIDRAAH